MRQQINTDICVIGGGAGGLSLAAGAAQMGARTVLVEGHKMGGDCLNTGCVPSKALLMTADLAHSARHFESFGLNGKPPEIQFAQIMRQVQEIISEIEPMDSVERFSKLGVQVIEAQGKFIDRRTLVAGKVHIRAKRFVIATGSTPHVPSIRGLKSLPYLTNETLWTLKARPSHLLIIGGGPIGIEMAQAFSRLGSKVTVLEAAKFLGREDRELVEPLLAQLRTQGVRLHEGLRIASIRNTGGQEQSSIAIDTDVGRITGSHILVAAGRKPQIDGLNLKAATVALTDGPLPAIKTNTRLQTSNRKIYAIGDVACAAQFTHLANYHAGIVIRNILFFMPAKVNYTALPRVTYGTPELAHVGVTETEARARYKGVKCLRWHFDENDRARIERDKTGLAKIVTTRNGRILGASIVGRHAGDLLAPWTLALAQGLHISTMAGVIAPYPTRGEVSKRVAGDYYTPSLFSPRTRRLVRFLSLLRR